MRIVKASAVALAFSLALGAGMASAADAPAEAPKHWGWAHSGQDHHFCAWLKALLTHHKSS